METKQLLQAVRDLLSDKSHWTQYVSARDAKGKQVEAQSNKACAWCLIGAFRKLEPDLDKRWEARVYLMSHLDTHSTGSFNDTHSHEEVLQLLDKALA